MTQIEAVPRHHIKSCANKIVEYFPQLIAADSINMAANFVFLLLTVSLLVQCSFGKSLTESTVSKSAESSSEEVDPGAMELLDFILKEFSEMGDSGLEKAIKLLEDVVAELSAVEDKSETLKEKIKQLTNTRDRMKEVGPQIPKEPYLKYTALVDLKDWSKKHTDVESSPEDAIILDSLQKNGMETLKKELRGKFSDFLVRFYGAVDKFWNSLSAEKQNDKKEFAEWLEKLKKETDVEQQMEMFDHLFTMNNKEGKEGKEGKEESSKE